jgi:hypothetical protein
MTSGITFKTAGRWALHALVPRGIMEDMWKITALDYSAPLFTYAEACTTAGIGEPIGAKWMHRGIIEPTRRGHGGRGGHLFSALKIFEMRILNQLVEQLTIPPSEAKQMADLAANGKWKSHVLRDHPHPLNVFLVFHRVGECWEYEMAGSRAQETFKNSASVVLAAARELTEVSKACWNILNSSTHAKTRRDG